MKILIIEDTKENLDTAKLFFSTLPADFVYVKNRKEAESVILTVDAVITDRSIPFDVDSNL